jgi:hypothetical protein
MGHPQGPALARSLSSMARALPALSLGVDSTTWRASALALLLFSATVDHYAVDVAGVHVKAEHVVVLGLFVVLAAGMARDLAGGRKVLGWRQAVTWPLAWLAPYLAVTLLSSAINSPDVSESLKHTALIAIVAMSAVVVYWLANTGDMLRLGVKMLVALGVLEAAYVFIVLLAADFGSTLGTQPGSGHIIVPFGTLWEPNLLGSYLAAAGVLIFSFLFVVSERRGRIGLALCLLVIMTALALSLARASWIGIFVGGGVVALLYFLESRVKKGDGIRVPWARALVPAGLAIAGTLLFLATVGALLFPTTTRGGILVRVNPAWYDPARDPSVSLRVSATRGALDDIQLHPIIGSGAGSYGMTHTDNTGAEGWISNLELHILYDSGLLGLLSFAVGLGFIVWSALSVLFRKDAAPDKRVLRPYIIGLVGALALLLFAFQATEGTWMAFFWVYVGLLAAVSHGAKGVQGEHPAGV